MREQERSRLHLQHEDGTFGRPGDGGNGDVAILSQPAPAPRFSRTPSAVKHGGHDIGQDTDAVLAAMGFAEQEIAALKKSGAIA